MFIEGTGRLFVHTFDSEYASSTKEFLISCCEPVSRPHHVNEYVITPASLSAAAAEGTYSISDIRAMLVGRGTKQATQSVDRRLPREIDNMLRDEERSEKLQLVLQPDPDVAPGMLSTSTSTSKGGAPLVYCLQCSDRAQLDQLVKELAHLFEPFNVGHTHQYVISDIEEGTVSRRVPTLPPKKRSREDGAIDATPTVVRQQLLREQLKKNVVVYKCKIRTACQRQVREALYNKSIRVQSSYDYAKDIGTPVVEGFTLRLGVRLRPYQEASLERFRRGQRAHNGVVVLPCGAGKTLTGIAASSIVGRRVIVMCCNVLSVMQWQREFLRWTNLRADQVTVCVRGMKQRPGDVFITTYSMLTAQRAARPADAVVTEDALLTQKILSDISTTTWGMLLLDEVHIAPADRFREVINCVRHHCVVGLSATLLREDMKIDNLRFLVGPKLYEANWLELTERGFLAPVVCVDVRCPMPPSYLRTYLDPVCAATEESLRDVSTINPYKLWTTQALLHFHGSRSPPDKVIIFCDSIPAVEFYATTLCVPFMDGRTPEAERATLLEYFRKSSTVNTIVLSRVGDIALDIPEASVIIQLSGLGASRRQEAQRLGRILRPKPPSVDNACAYFYTLVSEDTDESRNAFGRQEWLRDQGFAYRMMRFEDVMSHYEQRPLQRQGNGTLSCATRRLCVGPPKWYWWADGTLPRGLLERYPLVAVPASLQDASIAVSSPLQGSWVSFTRSESERIDDAFRRGSPSVVLLRGKDQHHAHHHRHHHHEHASRAAPTHPTLAAKVVFSAVDAPTTFGTVQFEIADATGGPDSKHVERRIAKHVPSVVPHHCGESDECLSWLLQRVTDAKRTVAR